MSSSMPSVAAWADDLRAVFGRDEMQDALRKQGYYASEGGKTLDTRKLKPSVLVTPVLPLRKKGPVRG